jgi:xylitol oxidase
VSVAGGVTYAQLAEELNAHGLALQNLASLPHISVAGAVATASHGSGDRSGNLATAVSGIDLVLSDGSVRSFRRGEPSFNGIVVGVGALGVVVRLTLEVEPYYEVRQWVFDDMPWEALFEHYDEITGAGDSVSVFHLFGDATEQVWVKRRAADGEPSGPAELLGARPAPVRRHPIAGADPVNATEQLGIPGPWSERLPHFRSGFTPSSGEELQAEFFVARGDAVAAIQAVRELSDSIRPLLLVSELRTIAADDLWLSPHYRRDSTAIHFTWKRKPSAVEHVLRQVEAALAPFAARPHWGKVFTARAETIAPLYDRMDDFRRLRADLDPRGAFVNDWLRERVLADA